MKKLLSTLILLCLIMAMAMGQELKKEADPKDNTQKTFVKLKEGENPDIYIDGKKYDKHMLDLIDPDRIESISVIKGEMAKERYDADAVILVKTKPKPDLKPIKDGNGKYMKEGIKIAGPGVSKNPAIVINGKIEDKETLNKLDPDEIQRIEVLKDETSLKIYGTSNGAILVTTKESR